VSGYASGTTVTADRSRAEIEHVLARFGADQFMVGWDATANIAVVSFRLAGRMVRMTLPFPSMSDPLITTTPGGRSRTQLQIEEEHAKEVRRRWRSLLLVLKAKLAAVTDGISTLEREFLSDILLPDGRTTGEWLQPQLAQAYDTGRMPALMPGASK
jgi:hypothetical protein